MFLLCKDYAGVDMLKKTFLEEAEVVGRDIAAVRKAMKAAYGNIKDERTGR